MTPYTDAPLGREPSMLNAAVDYWRRRAEKAEALLQEAMHLHCLRDPDDELEVLRADVAAHFDQVKP